MLELKARAGNEATESSLTKPQPTIFSAEKSLIQHIHKTLANLSRKLVSKKVLLFGK